MKDWRKTKKRITQKVKHRIEVFAPLLMQLDWDAYAAYEAAGFVTGNKKRDQIEANKLANHDYTQEFVHRLQMKQSERALATAQEKRELLWKIAKKTAAEEDVYDKDGNLVGHKLVDPRSATGAIAELNKMDGDLAAIQLQHKGDATQKVIIKHYK